MMGSKNFKSKLYPQTFIKELG